MLDEHVYEIVAGDLRVGLTPYGASINSVTYKGTELTLGYADPNMYRINPSYFASSIGRFGNRIKDGRCNVDGISVELARNDGQHHLHGGPTGFHTRTWTPRAAEIPVYWDGQATETQGITFSLTSPDGDEGYPGTLHAEVSMLVDPESNLYLYYRAVCDRPSPINLTNHAYWNLDGEGSGSIHDHRLKLWASGHLETDAGSIPTGRFVPQHEGPFDFRDHRRLGEILSDPTLTGPDIPAESIRGVDHCFVLNVDAPSTSVTLDMPRGTLFDDPYSGDRLLLRKAAELRGKNRGMEVWTSLPGLQVYSGNFLRGSAGRNGHANHIHYGLCLETQRFPDAPNQAAAFRSIGSALGWPEEDLNTWDAIIRPGTIYRELTVHRFF